MRTGEATGKDEIRDLAKHKLVVFKGEDGHEVGNQFHISRLFIPANV